MGTLAATAVVLIPLWIIGMIVMFAVGTPASNLQKAFVAAGDMRGKTKEEIIAFAGPPNSITEQADGKTLLQWMRTSGGGGYHIALLFDANGRMETITHQHSS